jgi:HSP20 family protein
MASIVRRQEPAGQLGRRDPFRMFREMMGRDFPDMGSLLDWSPFRELESLMTARTFSPDIEVREAKDHYTINVDLPGMKEGDVEVSISGNRLTVSGKREEERREEGEQLYLVERSYGAFTRSFVLPEGADTANVKADLKDGVLRIDIPKKAGEAVRQIPLGEKPREMAAGGAVAQPARQGEEKGGKPAEKKAA